MKIKLFHFHTIFKNGGGEGGIVLIQFVLDCSFCTFGVTGRSS